MFALLALLSACGPQPGAVEIDGASVITVHDLAAVPLPSVTVTDTSGAPMTLPGGAVWTVEPPAAGSVDPVLGTFQPAAEGPLVLKATVGQVSTTIDVQVVIPDEILVSGLHSGSSIAVGESVLLSAAVVDQGAPLEGFVVTWESSDPAVAEVAADGQLRALSPGEATLFARSGAMMRAVSVQVVAPSLAEEQPASTTGAM
ncbi:MAG: Ig-like domain-containing protein [Alphaproteobacteria bacterium]|nr:Ig-like domain-containing protein [Alphaproteobacteria bacterium]